MGTATISRIRRCNRETEFAVAQNLGVLSARPDAKPAGSDDFTIDSFLDSTAHAQALLNEKFSVLSSNRRHEAAETSVPLRIGADVPVAPKLPRPRFIDEARRLNSVMLMSGIAVDLETDRNSVEAVG